MIQEKRPGLMPILAACLVLLLAVAACSAPSPASTAPPVAQPDVAQVSGLLAASEMVVGENRFPFGLVAPDGALVEGAQVHASFYKLLGEGRTELKAEADATFLEVVGVTPHQHADGEVHPHREVRGVYVVDRVNLDEAGFWQARFQVQPPGDAPPLEGRVAFEVKEVSATLAVGDAVPPSRNPTARDVQDLAEITTHHPPVPGFYQLTVAEALEQARPLVVIFATPAFCASRMCGPVADVVAGVYQRYGDRANFIHIEPWDLKTARNEGRLVTTEIFREWRLPSEPWVFVVDAQGRVAARFEGLVGTEELTRALDALLR